MHASNKLLITNWLVNHQLQLLFQVKFYCSAAAPPDDLFDTAPVPVSDTTSSVMHREMLGELHADITSPSLPNISNYDTAPAATGIARTPPALATVQELKLDRLSMFTGE